VIGDISCGPNGSAQCTVRATDPGNLVYVYDPLQQTAVDGVAGDGPVVMAVDILPTEIAREASDLLSGVLKDFLPALASADFSVPFEDLALPDALRRATIVHRGQLTPDYRYLEPHAAGIGSSI
jgi:saccharopine dehydrogenase (NAD+, L-lysine forming)